VEQSWNGNGGQVRHDQRGDEKGAKREFPMNPVDRQARESELDEFGHDNDW